MCRKCIGRIWIYEKEWGKDRPMSSSHTGSDRRLISILNRNLEKGTRDVCEMLEEEAREAWEIRKNQAKKAGEEAGMKLLFPMMLLFILILVMLLFPAVQSFSL